MPSAKAHRPRKIFYDSKEEKKHLIKLACERNRQLKGEGKERMDDERVKELYCKEAIKPAQSAYISSQRAPGKKIKRKKGGDGTDIELNFLNAELDTQTKKPKYKKTSSEPISPNAYNPASTVFFTDKVITDNYHGSLHNKPVLHQLNNNDRLKLLAFHCTEQINKKTIRNSPSSINDSTLSPSTPTSQTKTNDNNKENVQTQTLEAPKMSIKFLIN